MQHSVLVVDDRSEIRQTLTHLIEADGRLRVAGTAGDGLEALQQCQDTCPDAIILDLEMPRMDGLQALPLLRKSGPDCVIVMYSSDPDRANAAPQLGADAVVDKGDDPGSLLDLVEELCQISRRSKGP